MKSKIKVTGIAMVENGLAQDDSYEAIRSMVSIALQNQVRVEANDYEAYCWIQSMYPDQVVYSIDGEYYQRSYKVAGDAVTFGDAIEVELSYTPVAADESDRGAVTSRALVAAVHQISEGFNAATGEISITVIKPGFNKSRERYYPAEVLKRDYRIFEGAKMFADHQTDSESRARPEGSIRNWVANVKKVWTESDGTIKGSAVVIDPPFKAKLEELAKNNMLPEMGVSIRAIGEAVKKDVEGVSTNYVESLLRSRSVDFVTYAGAGGQVEALESNGDSDVDLVTEAQLRERRPDLITIIESTLEKKMQKTLEQQLAESNAAVATEKKRADTAEAKVAESEKTAKKASASSELTKLLSESKLPQVSQDRLKKQFAEADSTDGMKEAVESEKAYVKSIAPGAGVRNMGAGDNQEGEGSSEKKPNLVESFKSLGLSDEESKIAAAGKR